MVRIKKTNVKTVIAFNNSGLPLGKRSQADLIDLAILARESNDPTILEVFDYLPSLKELKKQKMAAIEKKVREEQNVATRENNAPTQNDNEGK